MTVVQQYGKPPNLTLSKLVLKKRSIRKKVFP